MPIYLALKEIWYNKGRFLLIAAIVALITTLVLFIAALAEGLGNGNREYLSKINGELLIFQKNVDLSIAASQLNRATFAAVRRVPGIAELGQISFASGELLLGGESDDLNVSLIGVEVSKPGEPVVIEGRQLSTMRSQEALIDINVVNRTPYRLGDTIVIKTTQGVDEETFELKVVGVTNGSQYFIAPGIILPFETWERVRPQGNPQQSGKGELVSNVIAVKLENPGEEAAMKERIALQVDKVDVVDLVTAYENTPGYSAQQSTLNTQRYFTLLIGILVVGGFFQFQTLQKIAQVGMLKAIGASSFTVGMAALTQIIVVNAFGVLIGAVGTQLLKLGLPPAIPIVFTGEAALAAIGLLMVIGPLGGLVSVFILLRVEPLRALGLAQWDVGFMDALQAVAVSKIYGDGVGAVRAVDEVSFSVKAGQFVALLGPSGSGKTTMLAMMAGLLRPTGGNILIGGEDLTRMSDGKRTRFRGSSIGFAFQSNNLIPFLTALENVELMLRLNGKLDRKGKDRARELLVRLGLEERLGSHPAQLSGGQQQRVAIPRALIHEPNIVLADEPTASLDTERANQVVQTFADLIHEQKRAGIMVTHDLRMCRFVDAVILMEDGKIRQILSAPDQIEALVNGSSVGH